MRSVRFIGPGKAGHCLSVALGHVGWRTVGMLGRGDDVHDAAGGVDVLVLSTPDDAIGEVAASVRPDEHCVVLHLSGSLGLEVLEPHRRRAALHPLVPLPDSRAAARLEGGIAFAVAGDPLAAEMATQLGGRAVEVTDEHRAAYHAAACIAANHVVALLGQVERVANGAGLELRDFLGLTHAALDDVERLGPQGALTGPAVRGDWETLARHRDALDPEERPGYHAGVALALRLAGQGAPAPAALRPGDARRPGVVRPRRLRRPPEAADRTVRLDDVEIVGGARR